MRAFPTAAAYSEAIQVPELAFQDPELQDGFVEETALGLPVAITGAFAVVFKVRTARGVQAVKCYLVDQPGRSQRYRAYGRFLKRHPCVALHPVSYQARGIHVDGAWWPVVVMPWLEGESLHGFVDRHLHAPDHLGHLADAWVGLMRSLAEVGFTHGDLQHGNVLVADGPEGLCLHLIDYDAVHPPETRWLPVNEHGHRNYQHPDLPRRSVQRPTDHYSSLVIYTALRACQARPTLWHRHDTGENLLFRAPDFIHPETSALLLEMSDDPELKPLAEQLVSMTRRAPEQVPPLGVVLGLDPDASAEKGWGQWGWQKGASWLLRSGLVLGLFLTAIGGFLGGEGAIRYPTWGLGGALLLALAIGGFLKHPARRRRRALWREQTLARRQIQQLEAEAWALAEARNRVGEGIAGLRDQMLAEQNDARQAELLKHVFINRAIAEARVGLKVIVRLKAAGIRSAWHLTPAYVQRVTGVSTDALRRLMAWRVEVLLSAGYKPATQLTPVDELRLRQRQKQQESALDASLRALQRRLAGQRTYLQEVGERLDRLVPLQWSDLLLGRNTVATGPVQASIKKGDAQDQAPKATPDRDSGSTPEGVARKGEGGDTETAGKHEPPWWVSQKG